MAVVLLLFWLTVMIKFSFFFRPLYIIVSSRGRGGERRVCSQVFFLNPNRTKSTLSNKQPGLGGEGHIAHEKIITMATDWQEFLNAHVPSALAGHPNVLALFANQKNFITPEEATGCTQLLRSLGAAGASYDDAMARAAKQYLDELTTALKNSKKLELK